MKRGFKFKYVLPQLRKKVEEGSLFCPNCGAKVVESLKEASSKSAKGVEESKGFFTSLFDFSFTKFITIKSIKVSQEEGKKRSRGEIREKVSVFNGN